MKKFKFNLLDFLGISSIIIWIIVGISIFTACSCIQTPEQKIIHTIKDQGAFRAKILGVNIIDTIYEKDVIDTLMIDFDHLDSLTKYLKIDRAEVDTMYRHYKEYSRKEFDSLRKVMFEKTQKLQNLRDFTQHRIWHMRQLHTGKDFNSISGYWVILRTQKDTLEYVLKSDYKILAPKFMLEYHERPLRKFNSGNNPNFGRSRRNQIPVRRF